MEKLLTKAPVESALVYLPSFLAEEIRRLADGRIGGLYRIREIRIRKKGICSVLIGEEWIRLFSPFAESDMDATLDKLIGNALYAHRQSIANGYVSLQIGVRVGLCGSAAYDGDEIVGVSQISSLVFRIPSGECAFSDQLYEIYSGGIGRGMIIYSPPGIGKTTAIRTLARLLGGGSNPLRVVVIDERGELDEFDYLDCSVDILRGYKKSSGIEIATRTMSPEIIMIDEIGAEESEAILSVLSCGIPIIATAHAGSLDELLSRISLSSLFLHSAFSYALGIRKEGEKYILSVDEI